MEMVSRLLSRLETIDERTLARIVATAWVLLHGTLVLWPYIERLVQASNRHPVGPFA